VHVDRSGRVLVTGGAGFIGTVLVRHLLDAGVGVIVADLFPTERQRARLAELEGADVVRVDLTTADLRPLLGDVRRVVHLAGCPGVQSSWGQGFTDHLRDNVALTQRLLEAALDVPVDRIVVASSSSVYGHVELGVADEERPVAPTSPYGVTKAAVELLLRAYAARGVPAVGLRYFTVYGRGQRPDMAVHGIVDAALGGAPFRRRGDGSQERDLTHVDDVVAATARALERPLAAGTILNVAGGQPVSLAAVIEEVASQVGAPVPIEAAPPTAGDPGRTAASLVRAASLLDWAPVVPLRTGIADQIEWQARQRREVEVGAGRAAG
jgi:nucleoside-diphosphate-sugar epimerase